MREATCGVMRRSPPFLNPNESAVDVRHLAATPVGHEVSAQAEVVKVDGRHFSFNVAARDEMEEIGAGTHEARGDRPGEAGCEAGGEADVGGVGYAPLHPGYLFASRVPMIDAGGSC
jgi:hypothetical protein